MMIYTLFHLSDYCVLAGWSVRQWREKRFDGEALEAELSSQR